MSNRIIDELNRLAQHNEQADMVSDKSNELASVVTNQARRVMKQIEQMVTSHPVAALSAAVAAGMVLGWWVKRK